MNWYKESLLIAEFEREAGMKENFITALLSAILMVFGGSTIFNAAQKNNVSEEDLQNALQNEQLINQAKGLQKEETSYEQMPSDQEIFDMIKSNEAIRDTVYLDSKGHPTIGIGFNLNRGDAERVMSSVGANYKAILSGQEKLTLKQIISLYQNDVQNAISDARQFVNNFDKLPKNAKLVLIDMAFNMGLPTLRGFQNMKAALENYDFKSAANEMINSDWYGQTGNRSKKLVSIMQSIG